MTGIQIKADGIGKKLDTMISRAKNARAYLNRIAYPMYQEAQLERWKTENVSEGAPWKRLSPRYLAQKKIRFASEPYSGRKMLVATGRLLKSVVGSERRYHRKIVTDKKLIISTTVPYAAEVAEVRPFMVFGNNTKKKILEGFRKYVVYG